MTAFRRGSIAFVWGAAAVFPAGACNRDNPPTGSREAAPPEAQLLSIERYSLELMVPRESTSRDDPARPDRVIVRTPRCEVEVGSPTARGEVDTPAGRVELIGRTLDFTEQEVTADRWRFAYDLRGAGDETHHAIVVGILANGIAYECGGHSTNQAQVVCARTICETMRSTAPVIARSSPGDPFVAHCPTATSCFQVRADQRPRLQMTCRADLFAEGPCPPEPAPIGICRTAVGVEAQHNRNALVDDLIDIESLRSNCEAVAGNVFIVP